MKTLVKLLARSHSYFVNFLRISIFIVMAWIGGLKAFHYEAEGIVPFVANSPLMSFFYNDPSHYASHKNKEGEVVSKNVTWNIENGTYRFAYGLGAAIIIIGFLTLSGIWSAKIGLIGGILTFGMSFVTLSFLITTPESYVANLGGSEHGFPLLSGAGRLVVKDIIMMAGGILSASESARRLIKENKNFS